MSTSSVAGSEAAGKAQLWGNEEQIIVTRSNNIFREGHFIIAVSLLAIYEKILDKTMDSKMTDAELL